MVDGVDAHSTFRTSKRAGQAAQDMPALTPPIGTARVIASEKSSAIPVVEIPVIKCRRINGAEKPDSSQFWEDADAVKFNFSCKTGGQEGPETSVRFLWDAATLYYSVDVQEDSEQYTQYNNPHQIWKGNNIELIISPRWTNLPFHDEYEFLFNSSGHVKPLHWNGIRDINMAMRWQPQNLKCHFSNKPVFARHRYGWSFYGEIPIQALRVETLNTGDAWRLGLYRRHITHDQRHLLLAWSPTVTDPPQFHIPAKYGMLLFE